MRVLLNMSAVLMLVGCGTYEVPKTEVKEAAGECGEERFCSEADDVAENEDVAENDTGAPSVEVSVEVDVKVSVNGQETSESGDKAQLIFEPKAKTWAKHIDDTPEGYRLMTRYEVIKALETGALDDLMDDDEVLWTSSDSAQTSDMAWLIGQYDDFAASKTLEFPTLYIAQ